MATQTVQTISRTGLDLLALEVAADVGLSEKWLNTGYEFLEISTVGTGTTCTLVYQSGASVDGVQAANKTVVLGTNARKVVGPFPTTLYNDTSGFMNITWSSPTTVKLVVFKLNPNN